MIVITIDDFGKITVSGDVDLFTYSPLMSKCGPYYNQTTLGYQNVFDPMENGSLTGLFTDAWNPLSVANDHTPNIFNVMPGWICNGNGVVNAPVTFVGDAINETITIAPGYGGFQSGEYYTFTGV